MIKYIFKPGNAFSFDTVTEDVDRLNFTYLGDFWLIEKDGEMTIYNRDGSKQVMPVAAGDLVTNTWIKGKEAWAVVKDANLLELVKRRITDNLEPKDGCANGEAVD